MTDIKAGLVELAEKRNEKYIADVRVQFPRLTALNSMTWLGHYSWTNAEEKRRFLDEAVIVDSVTGFIQTPPEVSRDYLRVKYTEARRHTLAQYRAINEPRSAPMYCKIGVYPDMAYVDIKAAYWTIIKIVGWDVDYHPGRWIGKRSENEDFPIPDNKLARNCLVTAGLMTPTHVWTGEKLKPFQGHNTLVNYDLWALAQDVLHALATIALKAGAVYVHTDGYIVPQHRTPALIEEISKWGLRAGVKGQGDCEIYAMGCYKIGNFATKHKVHFKGHDMDKVYRPDIAFLKPRISKLAKTSIRW